MKKYLRIAIASPIIFGLIISTVLLMNDRPYPQPTPPPKSTLLLSCDELLFEINNAIENGRNASTVSAWGGSYYQSFANNLLQIYKMKGCG